jgi:hypothetical protein
MSTTRRAFLRLAALTGAVLSLPGRIFGDSRVAVTPGDLSDRVYDERDGFKTIYDPLEHAKAIRAQFIRTLRSFHRVPAVQRDIDIQKKLNELIKIVEKSAVFFSADVSRPVPSKRLPGH